MTEPLVNPLVGGGAPDAELVTPEVDQTEPAPIAETPPEPSIERRSRRSGKNQPAEAGTPEQPKPTVDLTQSEEFRRWQAEADKRLETERKKAADLERQLQDRQQKEAFDRLQYLETVMDDESAETADRKAARQEYQFLSAQAYAQQWQRWEQYKREQIVAEGLDPNDPTFSRQYSPGQTGLAEFQADLAVAANAKLKQELAQAKKQAVTPETLTELVRQELARLAKTQGMDQVDLGEPDAQTDKGSAFERDWMKVNSGQMTRAEFNRKYPNGW